MDRSPHGIIKKKKKKTMPCKKERYIRNEKRETKTPIEDDPAEFRPFALMPRYDLS